MDVRGERTADAEIVGARLLLSDRPSPLTLALQGAELANQSGPLNSRLHLDQSARSIEGDDTIKAARVEEDAVFDELLAAHRVPRTGNADSVVRCCADNRRARVGDAAYVDDVTHPRRVEPRVDVVDDHWTGARRIRRLQGEMARRVGARRGSGAAHECPLAVVAEKAESRRRAVPYAV